MAERLRTGWWALVAERLALPALLVLSTGLSASAQLVAGGTVELPALAVASVAITGLLGLLRLMDDLKDLDRDRVAHPERPLARGALTRSQAERGVAAWSSVLFVLGAVISLAGNPAAGLLLTVCVAWALLMYREFFASRWLAARPLLYALTHQVIVLPMYGFAAATAHPDRAFSPEVAWFALSGLGASFTWEVCRKLDPSADPVLRTYLHHYGRVRTALLALGGAALVAVAAPRVGAGLLLVPAVGLVAAAVAVAAVRPRAFRWAVGAAGLLLVIQPLSPALLHLWSSP